MVGTFLNGQYRYVRILTVRVLSRGGIIRSCTIVMVLTRTVARGPGIVRIRPINYGISSFARRRHDDMGMISTVIMIVRRRLTLMVSIRVLIFFVFLYVTMRR